MVTPLATPAEPDHASRSARHALRTLAVLSLLAAFAISSTLLISCTGSGASIDSSSSSAAATSSDAANASSAATSAATSTSASSDAANSAASTNAPAGGYQRVSGAEAAKIMESETGYIVVDARTHDEFAQGHVPGAICIPVQEIGTTPPAELPDKDQMILIYCRSGNRSVQAADKLVAMGYTNIVEFGGLAGWPGAPVTD